MAYTRTLVANAGEMIVGPHSFFNTGTVITYAAEDFIFTAPFTTDFDGTTDTINYLLQNGILTHMDGSTTVISGPNAAIYVRSGTADVPPPMTLTAKTVAGLTKAAQLIGENRTHIKTAESDIAGLKTRVTAAEGSIATVDQRIADAETRAKNSAVEQIMGGATSAALDTIKELGDALTNLSGDGVAAINAALAKRVSVDAQTWTSNEQAQARTNIGAASGSDVTNAISASVGDPSTIDIDAIFASVGTF